MGATIAMGCGGDDDGSNDDETSSVGSSSTDASTSGGGTTAATEGGDGDDDDDDDDGDTDDDTDGDTDEPPVECAVLADPGAGAIDVAPGDDLAAAISGAPAGATIMLADGTYEVGAQGLWFGADDVTLRGASGDRGAVVLDGAYQQQSGGMVNISGRSGITVAHLTIRRARYHLVHVTGGPDGPSQGARLLDLHLVDPGEQAVKINSNYDFDSDDGEVACSLIELTDEGRAQVMQYESSGSHCYTGGIDAHRAWNWVVRDNVIEGFWCSNADISQHGVNFWRGSRDTIVERNLLIDNARGIGLGLGQPAGGRTFEDDPCPGLASAEHYGGVVRNNMIVGRRPELFASPSGMDLGIALDAACEATVVHNTVASTDAPFSSIEWRWAETTARIVNNLVTHNLRARDGATAQLVGNVESADPESFVDLHGADAHLVDTAAQAIDQGDPEGSSLAPSDFDGDPRDATPDVGADELVD